MQKISYISLVLFLLSVTACTTNDVFEEHTRFSDHAWKSTEKPRFELQISDTAALYKIYAVVRHLDAYHYRNLWLNLSIRQPNGKVFQNKRNLLLANDQDGWLGSGMDDIWEHRILLNEAPAKFPIAGTYQFSLEHLMREDPLESIMNVGIRVEKVTQ